MLVVGTQIKFAFGCTHDGLLHVQVAIVGVHAPAVGETIVARQLQAVIGERAGVHVEGTSRSLHHSGDEVVALDEKEVGTHMTTLPYPTGIGQLVVHHTFGSQVGIVRREHVHLANDGIAEALGDEDLDIILG